MHSEFKKAKLVRFISLSKGKKVEDVTPIPTTQNRRYIQIEDLRDSNNLKYTTSKGVHVDPSDVILAWDGANAGTVTYGLDGVIGSTLVKIRVDTNHLLPGFLSYFLHSRNGYLRKKSSGTTIPHISRDALFNLEIPIFPLSKQKRIVSILDQANEILQRRHQAIELLNHYRQNIFLQMFGNPQKNTKGWETGQIRDLTTEAKYGTSQKASTTGKFPYLRMNNITYSGELDLSDLKYIDPDAEDKYIVRKGDILFNRTNSKELVGKTTVFDQETPMVFAGYLIRLRTNLRATPEFISAYLNSNYGKSILRHMCKNIVGMANINARELLNISIPIPPTDLQERFSSIMKSCSELKQRMVNQSKAQQKLIESLSQKLLYS